MVGAGYFREAFLGLGPRFGPIILKVPKVKHCVSGGLIYDLLHRYRILGGADYVDALGPCGRGRILDRHLQEAKILSIPTIQVFTVYNRVHVRIRVRAFLSLACLHSYFSKLHALKFG